MHESGLKEKIKSTQKTVIFFRHGTFAKSAFEKNFASLFLCAFSQLLNA